MYLHVTGLRPESLKVYIFLNLVMCSPPHAKICLDLWTNQILIRRVFVYRAGGQLHATYLSPLLHRQRVHGTDVALTQVPHVNPESDLQFTFIFALHIVFAARPLFCRFISLVKYLTANYRPERIQLTASFATIAELWSRPCTVRVSAVRSVFPRSRNEVESFRRRNQPNSKSRNLTNT